MVSSPTAVSWENAVGSCQHGLLSIEEAFHMSDVGPILISYTFTNIWPRVL